MDEATVAPTAGSIEAVRKMLGEDNSAKSQAMLLALEEIAAPAGSNATWWPDVDGLDLGVYMVAAGHLHILTGPSDPPCETSKPDDPRNSRCEYRDLPITAASHARSTIECTTIGQDRKIRDLIRKWRFVIAGEPPLWLDINWPPPGTVPAEPNPLLDPSPFAKALVDEIIAAQQH